MRCYRHRKEVSVLGETIPWNIVGETGNKPQRLAGGSGRTPSGKYQFTDASKKENEMKCKGEVYTKGYRAGYEAGNAK